MSRKHRTGEHSKSPALPAVLAEIADHAGREAALAIALAHGGRSWRVPVCEDSLEGHKLVELIGARHAAALIAGCGNHVLEVPLARRAVVAWLAGRGFAVSQIAAQLRISRRTARRYIRETRKEEHNDAETDER